MCIKKFVQILAKNIQGEIEEEDKEYQQKMLENDESYNGNGKFPYI